MKADNDTGISTLLYLEEFYHKDLQIAHIYITRDYLLIHWKFSMMLIYMQLSQIPIGY